MRKLVLSLALLAVAMPAAADWVIGDARPDAPALAARGAYKVGVRTEQIVHRGQFDILRASSSNPAPRYDRAAHTLDATMTDMIISAEEPERSAHVSRSRDGTEASGIYDEDGGPIGGTTDELDSLEAGGTPVDRNPHMKD